MNIRTDKVNEGITLSQLTDGLLFGTDALMLSYFLCGKASKSAIAVEFGTGSGIIPLIFAKKTPEKIGRIYAVEIQPDYCELAAHNIKQNNLSDKITVIRGDIKNSDLLFYSPSEKLCPDSADLVFTNPPYMNNYGKMSGNEYKNIAKHEIMCNVNDIMKSAKRLLKDKADFFCVYPAERLQYLIDAMTKHNINPKIMRFIHPRANAAANLVLVKGKKNSNFGVSVLPPVILSEQAEMYEKGVL